MGKKRGGGAKVKNKNVEAKEGNQAAAEDTLAMLGDEEVIKLGQVEDFKRDPTECIKKGSVEGTKPSPAKGNKSSPAEGIKRAPTNGIKHESTDGAKSEPTDSIKYTKLKLNTEPYKEDKLYDDETVNFKEKIIRVAKKALATFTDIVFVEILIFLAVRYKTFLHKASDVALFLMKSTMQCWLAMHLLNLLLILLKQTGISFQFPVRSYNTLLNNIQKYLSDDFKLFGLTLLAIFFVNDFINCGNQRNNYLERLWVVFFFESGLFVLTPLCKNEFDTIYTALVVVTSARLLGEMCYTDEGRLLSSLGFQPFILFTQLVILLFWVAFISVFEVSAFLEDYVPDWLAAPAPIRRYSQTTKM